MLVEKTTVFVQEYYFKNLIVYFVKKLGAFIEFIPRLPILQALLFNGFHTYSNNKYLYIDKYYTLHWYIK